MKLTRIRANGGSYPCYQTGGGLLRFREATGKEASEANIGDTSEMSQLLYSLAKSACRRERVEFPYESCQDFMDDLLPEDIADFVKELTGEALEDDADGEKKSPSA